MSKFIEPEKYYIKSLRDDSPAFEKSFDKIEEAVEFRNGLLLNEYFDIAYNGDDPFINRILSEGLMNGDLVDLLKPVVSFDEYVAKNDSDNIVLAFFILNEPLAVEPLARFCETAFGVEEVDTSDSDAISNASVVYVEFKRTPDSKQPLLDLMRDVAIVAEIEMTDWMLVFPQNDGKYPYDEKLIDLYFEKLV